MIILSLWMKHIMGMLKASAAKFLAKVTKVKHNAFQNMSHNMPASFQCTLDGNLSIS